MRSRILAGIRSSTSARSRRACAARCSKILRRLVCDRCLAKAAECTPGRTELPMGTKYDLIVIGAGPAGEKGAAQAAYFGERVALIECGDILGGACVNTGPTPHKILRESALYFSGIHQRGLYGVDYSLREGLTVKNFM